MTSREIIKNKIISLEDDYQHYTMVDKDDYKAYSIKLDIVEHQQILKDLEQFETLKKIIRDYCYIDNFNDGEIIRMCCEENEESNNDDFVFLKGMLDNE